MWYFIHLFTIQPNCKTWIFSATMEEVGNRDDSQAWKRQNAAIIIQTDQPTILSLQAVRESSFVKNRPTPQWALPLHQFGFREKHGTVEQVNRITAEIRTAFENREYCTAIFPDVAQAFDRVWLAGLIFKITKLFPQNTHKLLKSYLCNRAFAVRYNTSISHESTTAAGVPQGSVWALFSTSSTRRTSLQTFSWQLRHLRATPL